MTNDEHLPVGQHPKSKCRKSAPERPLVRPDCTSSFGFRASFVIWHSSFVISIWHSSFVISLRLCFRFGGDDEVALVGERGEHCNNGHADESADAIELVQAGEVVEEQFKKRNAE